MRALILGDVHLADRPPSVRTEDYADLILAKIEFCAQTAIDQQVDAMVLAGDVFHIKRPDRTPNALVQRTIDLLDMLRKAGIEVAAVPGNHDMQNDRLESLEKQPLGVLFKAGVSPLIGAHPNIPIFGIPFLQVWDDLPRWVQSDVFAGWTAETGDRGLVVTHAPIMPPGRSAPYEYIDADVWANTMQESNLYYGHIHDLHGTYRAGDEGLVFCNQGAISRGSLHESDLSRSPAATLFNSDEEGTDRFKRVEIPHKPAEEVYALHVVARNNKTAGMMEEFVRRVGQTELSVASIEAIDAHLQTADVPPHVIAAARELVQEASCS